MSSTKTPAQDPWREELTPRGRASRRRWTVVLAVLLVLLGLTATSDGLHDVLLRDGPGARSILYGVMLLVVFGLLRRGTRRVGRLRGAELDERDRAARHRAFRTAFVLFLAVVVVTAWLLPEVLPEARRSEDGRVGTGWVLDRDDLQVLMWWFLAWALFLPTAALAWREPDAPAFDDDEADEPGPVLGDVTRDLLVALALVAGAAISAAIADDRAGLELLLAPLPLVALQLWAGARRTRRTGASWSTSVGRGWRTVLLMVILVGLLVTAGLLGAGGGSSDGGDDGLVEQRGPGVYRTTEEGVTDAQGREVPPYPCTVVISRNGNQLFGPIARREARRMGEPVTGRLCQFQ